MEEGVPLSPALDEALLHGASIGCACPKVLLEDGHRRLIAKFSSTTDIFPMVKAEFVAMELAEALGKDVLLVERCDRPPTGGRWALASALTILSLSEAGHRIRRRAYFRWPAGGVFTTGGPLRAVTFLEPRAHRDH